MKNFPKYYYFFKISKDKNEQPNKDGDLLLYRFEKEENEEKKLNPEIENKIKEKLKEKFKIKEKDFENFYFDKDESFFFLFPENENVLNFFNFYYEFFIHEDDFLNILGQFLLKFFCFCSKKLYIIQEDIKKKILDYFEKTKSEGIKKIILKKYDKTKKLLNLDFEISKLLIQKGFNYLEAEDKLIIFKNVISTFPDPSAKNFDKEKFEEVKDSIKNAFRLQKVQFEKKLLKFILKKEGNLDFLKRLILLFMRANERETFLEDICLKSLNDRKLPKVKEVIEIFEEFLEDIEEKNEFKNQLLAIIIFNKFESLKDFSHIMTFIPIEKIIKAVMKAKEKNQFTEKLEYFVKIYFEILKKKNKFQIVHTKKLESNDIYKKIKKDDIYKFYVEQGEKLLPEKIIIDITEYKIPYFLSEHNIFSEIPNELYNIIIYDNKEFKFTNLDIILKEEEKKNINFPLFCTFLNKHCNEILSSLIIETNDIKGKEKSNISEDYKMKPFLERLKEKINKEYRTKYFQPFLIINLIKDENNQKLFITLQEDFKNGYIEIKTDYSKEKKNKLVLFQAIYKCFQHNQALIKEYKTFESENITKNPKDKIEEIFNKAKLLSSISEIKDINEKFNDYIEELILKKYKINLDKDILICCITEQIKFALPKKGYSIQQKMFYIYLWISLNINKNLLLQKLRTELQLKKIDFNNSLYDKDERKNEYYIHTFSFIFDLLIREYLNKKKYLNISPNPQLLIHIEEVYGTFSKEYFKFMEIYNVKSHLKTKQNQDLSEKEINLLNSLNDSFKEITFKNFLPDLKILEKNKEILKDYSSLIMKILIGRFKWLKSYEVRKALINKALEDDYIIESLPKIKLVVDQFINFYSEEKMDQLTQSKIFDKKDNENESISSYTINRSFLKQNKNNPTLTIAFQIDDNSQILKRIEEYLNSTNSSNQEILIQLLLFSMEKIIQRDFNKDCFNINNNYTNLIKAAATTLRTFKPSSQQLNSSNRKSVILNKSSSQNETDSLIKVLFSIAFLKVNLNLYIEILLSDGKGFDFSNFNVIFKEKGAEILQYYTLKIIRSKFDSFKEFKVFNFTGNQMLWVSQMTFKENFPIIFEFPFYGSNLNSKVYQKNYENCDKFFKELQNKIFRITYLDSNFEAYLTKPNLIDIFIDIIFNNIIAKAYTSEYLNGMEWNEFLAWIENLIQKYKEKIREKVHQYYNLLFNKKKVLTNLSPDFPEEKKKPFLFLEIVLIAYKLNLIFFILEDDICLEMFNLLTVKGKNEVNSFYKQLEVNIPISFSPPLDDVLRKILIFICLSYYKYVLIENKHKKIFKDANMKEKLQYDDLLIESYDKMTKALKKININKTKIFSNILYAKLQRAFIDFNNNKNLPEDEKMDNQFDNPVTVLMKEQKFKNKDKRFNKNKEISKKSGLFGQAEENKEDLFKSQFVNSSKALQSEGNNSITKNQKDKNKIENAKANLVSIQEETNPKNRDSYFEKQDMSFILKAIQDTIEFYKSEEERIYEEEYLSFVKINRDETRSLILDEKIDYTKEFVKYPLMKYFNLEAFPSLEDFNSKFNCIPKRKNKYPLIYLYFEDTLSLDKVLNNEDIKKIIDFIVQNAENKDKYYLEEPLNNEITYKYDGFYSSFEEIVIEYSSRKNLIREKDNKGKMHLGVNYLNADIIEYNYDQIEMELSKIFFGININPIA